MSSIVVHPKDKKELQFITELLKKHGIESRVLSEEEKEDVVLSMLLQETDRTQTVSEEEVLKKLGN